MLIDLPIHRHHCSSQLQSINAGVIEKQERIDLLVQSPNTDTLNDTSNNVEKHQLPFHPKALTHKNIKHVVKKMPNLSAEGPYGISIEFITTNLNILTPFLTHIVHSSMLAVSYPDIFKLSKIIPLYKGKNNSKLDNDNYRPISSICSLGKISDTAVNFQMVRFCEDNGKVSNSRYAYRRGRISTLALVNALFKCEKAKM